MAVKDGLDCLSDDQYKDGPSVDHWATISNGRHLQSMILILNISQLSETYGD
jgi:hypothetical protein